MSRRNGKGSRCHGLQAMRELTRNLSSRAGRPVVATSVPRNRVVVHDALSTDLVAKDGFHCYDVVIVDKMAGDPAVHERVTSPARS